MPDPDPPSGAPLSENDVDRLSERFTASWDDPEPVTAEPATIPKASPALEPGPAAAPKPGPAAAAVPAAAPPIVPVAISAARPKATLLGIAPIVVGPSQPPPAAPSPFPLASPVSPTATPSVATSASTPAAVATSASGPSPSAPLPPPPPAPLPPPPSSSPDASTVLQGLTTPAKPYIPKDDPSTPAVVISDAALAGTERPRQERARIAQTIPALTRSAPLAAPAPVATIASAAASSTIDDTYPPLRRRGSKLPALLGLLAVAAAGAVAFVKLGGFPEKKNETEATIAPPLPPAAEPTPPPPVPEPAAAIAATSASPEVPTAAEPDPPPSPPAPVAAARKGKARKPPVVRKAAAQPRTEPKAASSPAPEPAPAAIAPRPAKGVIVRETPF